jgi:hypothetical protein
MDVLGIQNSFCDARDNHIFNKVLLSDGKWYYVDCTYDDPKDKYRTKYLLFNLVERKVVKDGEDKMGLYYETTQYWEGYPEYDPNRTVNFEILYQTWIPKKQ